MPDFEEPVFANLKVLIVDDYPSMLDVLHSSLLKIGLTNITKAQDGLDAWVKAIQASEEQPFDFIISDLKMPNMDGVELLRKIRTVDTYKRVPFLIISAESDKDNVLDAIQYGVSNYLIKPFDMGQLRDRMLSLLASLS